MDLDRYLSGLADQFGVPVERFAVPGVLVVPVAERAGQRRASHYRVDRHSVLLISPELGGDFGVWIDDSRSLTFDEFGEWARSQGATLLGRGMEHLLAAGYESIARAPEITVLDGGSATGIETVRTLLDDCSEDDLDEAEFEIDALDPYLVGWIEHDHVLALAGGRPEPMRPGCMDIGVLVHADARQSGRGRAVVAATVDEILAAGHVPLYRCNVDNAGSSRLCRSVGFEVVVEVEAFDWPDRSTSG